MARRSIPDPLARRHLLEQAPDPARAAAVAAAYLAEGRRNEALDFLVRADDRDTLARLRTEAVAEGDAFLLRSVCRALAEEPSAEEWSRLAEAAAAAGKESYASEARRLAERS